MNILIVGSGAREHALAWRLSRELIVDKIFVAPGNGGTEHENKCQNVALAASNIPALIDFAKNNDIALTVVGPEAPLSCGIVDEFEKAGLLIFGPSKAASQIESSKKFAKEVMKRAGIPTAKYEEFTDYEKAKDYVTKGKLPIVIKVDGLAAGKGVTVANTLDEALDALKNIFVDKSFGEAGSTVIIEDFLEGREATYLAITDGEKVIPFLLSQDHKRVGDNDTGANTGGMGAYAPALFQSNSIKNVYSRWHGIVQPIDRITETIALPMINELKKMGIVYKGVIYAGLMINGDDINVVEFNCRFGDPETQVVLPLVTRVRYFCQNQFIEALIASAKGHIEKDALRMRGASAVCVELVSGGYPASYKKGYEITGIEEAEKVEGVKVFHAGTKYENGKLLTNGGRVLCVMASARYLKKAIDNVYKACKLIHFENMHYRTDIAAHALEWPKDSRVSMYDLYWQKERRWRKREL